MHTASCVAIRLSLQHAHTTTGVRARQEKMPFAMIDDPVMVNAAVRTLIGQTVALQVTPDSVTLAPASSSQAAAAAAASSTGRKANGNGASGAAAAVSKVSTPRLVELLDCTPSLAGAKASACARLEQVGCYCSFLALRALWPRRSLEFPCGVR